jgi:ATP-dependent helicase HrpB
MLARRVAEEMGVRLGEDVGYQVRFENVAGRATRIRFVTEGILLRRMVDDPELRGVAAVVFDEFHERHLYGDISLARAL